MSFQNVVSQQAVPENATKNHSKRDSGFAEFFESVIDLCANKFYQEETCSNESGNIPYYNYLGNTLISKRIIHKNQPEDQIISPLEESFKPVSQASEINIFKKEQGIFLYWHTWTTDKSRRLSQRKKLKQVKQNEQKVVKKENFIMQIVVRHEDRILKTRESIQLIQKKLDEFREESKKNAEQIESLMGRIKL
ncbi:271_t:CDS:2 [Ambispora leptoticha]|uniref:271_t:CDS:1 n=1 Tax=Ambispora leptoticha TaxID=144679 RepID=A0A9N8ZFM3_9GLOM|nr:271_t:CDS:2 [Ambispora leptoticha]